MGAVVSEILVVGLGDSITAGNPGWDPDPARRELEDPGDDIAAFNAGYVTITDPIPAEPAA